MCSMLLAHGLFNHEWVVVRLTGVYVSRWVPETNIPTAIERWLTSYSSDPLSSSQTHWNLSSMDNSVKQQSTLMTTILVRGRDSSYNWQPGMQGDAKTGRSAGHCSAVTIPTGQVPKRWGTGDGWWPNQLLTGPKTLRGGFGLVADNDVMFVWKEATRFVPQSSAYHVTTGPHHVVTSYLDTIANYSCMRVGGGFRDT